MLWRMSKLTNKELARNVCKINFTIFNNNKSNKFYYGGWRIRRIKGYPSYWIIETGLVISARKPEKPHILKPWFTGAGRYGIVSLSRFESGEIVQERKYIHRLVAEHFCRKRNKDYNYVRHYDDNPLNNYASNLIWGTQKENIDDMRRNGNMYGKKVYCYELDKTWDFANDAAKEMGCTRSSITFACSGKIRTVKGYHFCYENNKEEKLRKLDEWLEEHVTTKPIVAIEEKTGKMEVFNSRREASRVLNIANCGISSCATGAIEHYKGYIFIDPDDKERLEHVCNKFISGV